MTKGEVIYWVELTPFPFPPFILQNTFSLNGALPSEVQVNAAYSSMKEGLAQGRGWLLHVGRRR
jgi:hypothetical protein